MKRPEAGGTVQGHVPDHPRTKARPHQQELLGYFLQRPLSLGSHLYNASVYHGIQPFYVRLDGGLFLQQVVKLLVQLDDESAVLIPRVLHGIQSLLGDATQVHIPPVLQHLERDVCTVDHRSRCLAQMVQRCLPP